MSDSWIPTEREARAAEAAAPVHRTAVALDASLPGMAHWLRPEPCGRATRNVFTVDLEDWPIAVLGPEHEVTGRVVENTRRLLHLLNWHHVKATFFVLTKVALRFPELVQEVHAAGHEIASHGHAHEPLTTISPSRFERDVRMSVEIINDLVGAPPIGYRAPAFSIVESTRWAGPILARLGFRYSSSIFPIRHRRYGIEGAPRGFHRWPDSDLIECPLATRRILGWNLPIAGGGYFRLLPGPVVRSSIRALNRQGQPAVLYVHPYELDVSGVMEHRLDGLRVGSWRHVTQALFRGRIESRLNRLLEQFEFATMRELLQFAL